MSRYMNHDSTSIPKGRSVGDKMPLFENEEVERLNERISELESENVRLNKRYDILAMHMAEVKAIADGCHINTLNDVVEHCLEALKELPR